MDNSEVKRCRQCGKILVDDNRLRLCPKCRDTDIKIGGGFAGGSAALFTIVKVVSKLFKTKR